MTWKNLFIEIVNVFWRSAKKTVIDYFRPLGKRWFWMYVFPPLMILSFILSYLEVYCGYKF